MSNIQTFLDKIKSERYGKDVRQAIHDGIKQCYEDGKANSGGSGATAEQIQQIKNHINDNTVHTTKEEKNSWNKTAVDLKGVAGLVNITKERVDNLSEEIVDLRDGTPIYIKWNGDVTDLESITIENSTLYKVSDNTYSLEELNECEIVAVMRATGAVMKLALSDCDVMQDASEYIAFKVPENTGFDVVAVAIVKEDTDTMKKGTYFIELNGIGYIEALGNVYLGYPTWDEVSGKPDEMALPSVTEEDNGKILTVVDGVWTVVTVEDSSVGTYIDNYINDALGGDY